MKHFSSKKKFLVLGILSPSWTDGSLLHCGGGSVTVAAAVAAAAAAAVSIDVRI